jgi:hypothetical protein
MVKGKIAAREPDLTPSFERTKIGAEAIGYRSERADLMPNDSFSKPGVEASTNPYASPVLPTEVTRAPLLPQQNLWRDGKRVVLLGPNFSFPACCVKTGRIDDLEPRPLTLKYVKHGLTWTIMFGVIGALIAQSLFGETLTLTLPVNRDWLAKKKKHSWIGLTIALGGGALFGLALVGVMASDPSGDGGEIFAIAMLVGMLVGLGGLIYMAAAGSVNLLTCHKMDGMLTWLDGASPEFLARLPDWSTMGPIGAPGVLRRS